MLGCVLLSVACATTGVEAQGVAGVDRLDRRRPSESVSDARARYDRHRQSLTDAEARSRFDVASRAGLSEAEKRANAILTEIRDLEVTDFKKNNSFPLQRSFYAGRAAIEKSPTFGILQEMPKGGALHVHSSSAGRVATLVDSCRRPECWVESQDDGQGGRRLTGQMRFIHPGSPAPPNFEPAADARARLGDEPFASQLTARLTLDEADEQSPDVWVKFGAVFAPLSAALSYEPVFEEYFLDAFRVLAADHVDYVELRTGLGHVSDLNGKQTPMIEKFRALRERVRLEIPGFDFKLIVSAWRGTSNSPATVAPSTTAATREALKQAMVMRQCYPDFVVGFDLVGEEDGGGTTYSFLDVWLELPALEKEYGVNMPLYFHDGESDWPDDDNLVDAYMMGSRRIGHGMNLYLFPSLERRFARRDVALEICPLSNQILGYVRDPRGHPASGYLRRGVPLVISSDDPALFGYEGLSYDYWAALMAWELDLASLKQLALNSITYSAMSTDEKRQARSRWQRQWDAFITDLIERKASNPP